MCPRALGWDPQAVPRAEPTLSGGLRLVQEKLLFSLENSFSLPTLWKGAGR